MFFFPFSLYVSVYVYVSLGGFVCIAFFLAICPRVLSGFFCLFFDVELYELFIYFGY